jgi:organic hydroperoxide reductase OsmC/OhrA
MWFPFLLSRINSQIIYSPILALLVLCQIQHPASSIKHQASSIQYQNSSTMTSSIIYNGDLRTTCTHLASGNQIVTDAPVDNQGRGEAFSPTDLVATALGACMMTIMGIKARDMGLDITGTKVDVNKSLDVGCEQAVTFVW